MSVRLVTRAEIEEWQGMVRAALGKAQERQRRSMTPILKAHGLTWGSPARATSVGLWSKDSWAEAVTLDVEPVVRAVAKKVVARLRSRVTKRQALGFNPEDRLVAMVLDKVLAIEPRLSIQPAAVTAAGSGTRFGGVTHPEANPTILDEYQARFAELDRMTERITAHMSDAAQQVLAEGAVASAGVKYVWTAVGDERTRPAHLDADGQAQAAGDPFDVDGEELMFPGDPDGSDENVDNCLPAGQMVTLPGLRASTRRWFEGELVHLRFASGHDLTVTANHPILRADGQWCPARLLQRGDHCVGGRLVGRSLGEPDKACPPAEVSEVHDTLALTGVPERERSGPPNFHGDRSYGEVDVVAADGLLADNGDPASDEQVMEFGFTAAYRARARACSEDSGTLTVRADGARGVVDSVLAASGVGSRRNAAALGGPGPLETEALGIGSSAWFDACSDQSHAYGVAGDPEGTAERERALTLDVSLDELVGVDVEPQWAGWVYNFDTGHGWYVTDSGSGAGGVLLRNCRCWLEVDGMEVDGDYLDQLAAEEDTDAA